MSGEFEAIADVATGAVVANAIEGTASGQREQGGNCLNCGTALIGRHCHGCGQPAHIHRSASALFHDIAHGVFHLEGRTWHTIPLLFWRPGELTRRYAHGERANFVSPMALFLFSVFLMVAVFAVVGGPFGSEGVVDQASLAKARTDAANDLAKTEKKIAALEEAKKAAVAAGKPVGKLDERIGDLRSDEAGLRMVAGGKIAPEVKDDKLFVNDRELATGISGVDKFVRHAAENPELTAYKLQSAAYKFSWALIPISLPFIWLLFVFRRDVGMYDHAVFATYSLSAMTLMVVLLSLANAAGVWAALLWLTFLIFPPWHMYRQLRAAYQLSRWGAWWRMWMLVFSAYSAALIFFVFLVTLGAMG